MKRTLKSGFLVLGLLSVPLASAGAAANTAPQLQIHSAVGMEVVLSWPATASDFVLEETRQLTVVGRWEPAASPPVLIGQDYAVNLASGDHTRFFRLRYQPSALRSTNSAISVALVAPDGTNAVAGQPFAVELRASINAVLAAVAVRLSAAGSAEATLTGRSADPAQPNGLFFVSATSQQPYASGLPVGLEGNGSLEVLLGTGAWPFDGVQPGEEVVLERLEITPQSGGEFTVSLAAVEAVTSRWARDGVRFETVIQDPWRSTVTVRVQGAATPVGLGANAGAPPAGERTEAPLALNRPRSVSPTLQSAHSPVGRPALRGQLGSRSPEGIQPSWTLLDHQASSRQQAQSASEITPNANGQGGVDLADLVFVRARLGLDAALPENVGADVNQDGTIDLLDLVTVRNRLSSSAGSTDLPAPRLSEIALDPGPQGAPWVEISYPPWIEPYFYLIELRNGADEVLLGEWAEPVLGWPGFLVVVFDGEKPMEYVGDPGAPTAVLVHLAPPANLFNLSNDQCRLYLAGQLVDAVSWGQQSESNAALNLDLFPLPPGGSIGRDGLEAERWVRFAQPTPGAENGLPGPLFQAPFDGAGLLRGASTRFIWVDPRYSPVAYELEVDDAEDFQTPLIHVTCYEPNYTHSPGLAPGKYFWRLRAQAGEVAGPWSSPAGFEVMELPVLSPQARAAAQSFSPRPAAPLALASTFVIGWFENNKVLGPRKDTTMVCLECDQETGIHAWDKPHGTPKEVQVNSVGLCPHELGHAATAIAATLNHFYGGDLTQDELNFEVFVGAGAGGSQPEGNLGHGALANLAKTFAAALGTQPTIDGTDSGSDPAERELFYQRLRRYLDQGTPAAAEIWMKASGMYLGPVIVYGYVQGKDLSGNDTVQLVAAGPFIAQGTVIAADSIGYMNVYWPGSSPGQDVAAAESDPELYRDSDGDGLCDLDELNRFGTDEQKADSDGDGIQDKTEVWSYKFGRGRLPRAPDPDGDGERAETDPDTDGDGCPDGMEDRNHNGTLFDLSLIQVEAGYVGIKGKETDETDPFSVDEFKVTLTAERMPLHFKECTRLDVKVTDKEGDPVEDAQVQFTMDPLIASFGATGGPLVTYVAMLTDKDGKASTDFCAQETEGTVTVTALYKPCPQGAESKAQLQIKILPYDWVFAVQEKAVLTGPEIVNDRGLMLREGTKEGVWDVSRRKDVGYQKISGTFYHPLTTKPGAYIESIGVGISYSGVAVLRVDGTNVNNLTWTRTSTNDLPARWEIEIASPIWSWEDYKNKLPRYLFVTTRGGPERRTPLLWWKDCGTAAQHRRFKDFFRRPPYPAEPYELYGRLLEIDYTYHSYEFFFGDGHVDNGMDPVCQDQPHPDPNGHTAVSFIPVKGIPGFAIGERKSSGWPFEWGFDPWDKQGGTYSQISNAYCKHYMSWVPDAPWTVVELGDMAAYYRYDIEAEMLGAGPPEPPDFVTGIRFKRDYIGNELRELQERKLDPPQYEIRMLTGE